MGRQHPHDERPDAHALGDGGVDVRGRGRNARRRGDARGDRPRGGRGSRPGIASGSGSTNRRPTIRRRSSRTTSTTTTGTPIQPRRVSPCSSSSHRRSAPRSTRWRKADRLLYGFAEHHLTSTFLGTSTGLRRRFDQPDGRVEINGKTADLTSSAYASQHTRDFARRRRRGTHRRTRQASGLGRDTHRPARRAVRDAAAADRGGGPALVYTYWNASARDAEEGRNVFAGRDGTSRIGERLSPAAVAAVLRSRLPRPGVPAVRGRHVRASRPTLGVRQRLTADRSGLGGRRNAAEPDPAARPRAGDGHRTVRRGRQSRSCPAVTARPWTR